MGNTTRFLLGRLVPVTALLWFAPGCPDGKDPPLPTTTVPFTSGQYVLGSPALACSTNEKATELQRCDTLGKADQNNWIEDNSWTPLATARLPGFAIEAHEVTNAQYRFCEESGKCTAPATSTVGGEDYYGEEAYDEHPVVNVSWEQAEAYCKFVKRKLPTEAQWEVAARLDADGKMRTFPYAPSKGAPSCTGGTYLVHKKCASTTPLAVRYSAADATAFNVRDMASNVSEWVRDTWSPYAYCVDKNKGLGPGCQTHKDHCGKCQGGVACASSCDKDQLVVCRTGQYDFDSAQKDPGKVVRGGSYLHGPCALRLFVRRKALPDPAPEIGFRCVEPNGGHDAGVTPDKGIEAGVDSGAEAGG